MSKTCDNYVMRLCDVIKYFTLILLQFEIICLFGHPGCTYMSTWFCYAKLGATGNDTVTTKRDPIVKIMNFRKH